jgi:hypothetical protein
MYGRNGTDKLNIYLAAFLFLTSIVSMFFKYYYVLLAFQIVEFLLFALFIFRFLSKNIYKRRAENEKFGKLIAPLEKFFKLKIKQAKDKDNKYFKCPKCSANLRVPKNRGNITVTCPVCKNKFDKRT